MADRPYSNGIGIQIQCRENFDTLLEMEQMGGKIRDTNNEYAGAEGRDDRTKFLISPRYGTIHSYLPDPRMGEPNFNPPDKRNNVVIRVWGTTFKPALKNECKRLGVKVFDRVMGTSLLTENGIQGTRVIGATGFNNRTGEFMIFKSRATILSTAGAGSIWLMSMELGGYSNMHSRTMSGDGTVMAWKAGAELTKMESTGIIMIATGLLLFYAIPVRTYQSLWFRIKGMPVTKMFLSWMLTEKNFHIPYRDGLTREPWFPHPKFKLRSGRAL